MLELADFRQIARDALAFHDIPRSEVGVAWSNGKRPSAPRIFRVKQRQRVDRQVANLLWHCACRVKSDRTSRNACWLRMMKTFVQKSLPDYMMLRTDEDILVATDWLSEQGLELELQMLRGWVKPYNRVR